MASIKVSVVLEDECQQATLYLHDEDFYKILNKVRVTKTKVAGIAITKHITERDALYLLAETVLYTGLTSDVEGIGEPLYDPNSIRRD